MANPWTKNQDAQLLAMFYAGEPKNAIARALDRPNSSIRSRLLTLGALGEAAEGGSLFSKPSGRRTKTVRSCMCCGASFLSEGLHNRLCNRCRTKSTSPYAH
ncbi:MAG TPA: hypothetical protein VJ576_02685 [Rhodocyclaceae bacterium]|nr:hypothetical protein [Rhodocyclaceae bacterium]